MHKPHILVIEDNQTIAYLIGTTFSLQPEQYEVSFAYDGLQGIERAVKLRPDIILLDICMPGANGYEVAQFLRSQGNTTPIIMLSCNDQESDRNKGYASGCCEYLIKPFKPTDLCASVKLHLRKHVRHFIQERIAS